MFKKIKSLKLANQNTDAGVTACTNTGSQQIWPTSVAKCINDRVVSKEWTYRLTVMC